MTKISEKCRHRVKLLKNVNVTEMSPRESPQIDDYVISDS